MAFVIGVSCVDAFAAVKLWTFMSWNRCDENYGRKLQCSVVNPNRKLSLKSMINISFFILCHVNPISLRELVAGGYPDDPGSDPAHPGGLSKRDCVVVDGLSEALCFAFRTDNSGPPESVEVHANVYLLDAVNTDKCCRFSKLTRSKLVWQVNDISMHPVQKLVYQPFQTLIILKYLFV